MDSSCCTNAWIMVPSDGRVRRMKHSTMTEDQYRMLMQGLEITARHPIAEVQAAAKISCSLCRMLKIKKCKSHQKTAEAVHSAMDVIHTHTALPAQRGAIQTGLLMWMVHPAMRLKVPLFGCVIHSQNAETAKWPELALIQKIML